MMKSKRVGTTVNGKFGYTGPNCGSGKAQRGDAEDSS